MRRLATLPTLAFAAALLAGCGVFGGSQPEAPSPSPAQQQARGGGQDEPQDYDDLLSDVESDDGLFVVHRNEDGDLLYEIPDSVLGREMLMVSRIAQTPDGLGYGGQKANTQTLRWERVEDRILLRQVSHSNVADDTLPIYQAVRSSNFEPVLASFDIEATRSDGNAVVIDATDIYTTDVPAFGLPQNRRNAYGVRRLDTNRSFLRFARSYPENIEVRSLLTYDATQPPSNQSGGTLSIEINHSMILLPAEPMQSRMWDDRVGFFSVNMTDYGLDEQRAVNRRYITRYRLEPSDSAAWLRGELVDPVEPIVYYIDPATPVKWRPYLKQGVEDWQRSFEAAGFRNAIIAMDPPTPEQDPEFSPEDVRYSVIRYFSSPTQNASGPHVHDPRTGEILESDINWYHNVMNLVRNWYFIQTAAANPEARGVSFDDDVMGQLIRFVAAHEVGHTLGLPHNMKASASYPVDSLRTDFVCRMGTAPSIMDYARFNYVAQPGDDTCFQPAVGPYDDYAISWGYGPVPNADSPEAERPYLNAMIREHENDPMFYFGNPSSYDPSSLTEAIGDDAMQASEYGIANLRRIVPNLIEWTYQEGEPYDQLDELYGNVISQWNRYLGHVVVNIGGVYRTSKTYDQPGAMYEPVPEATQRRAMQYLDEQAFQTPTWMLDSDILSRIEPDGSIQRIRGLQVRAVTQVLNGDRMHRLIEAEAMNGDAAYTLDEMLTDLRNGVWTELNTGAPIDVYRRNLQRGYLDRVNTLLNPEPVAAPTGFGGFGGGGIDVNQTDIRAYLRGELNTLRAQVQQAANSAPDRATRLHLEDVLVRIDEILDPQG